MWGSARATDGRSTDVGRVGPAGAEGTLVVPRKTYTGTDSLPNGRSRVQGLRYACQEVLGLFVVCDRENCTWVGAH